MTSLRSCVICVENYKTGDEISSTTCGHIFHKRCLENWLIRSTNCPQCRLHNPQHHRIYLNFEDNLKNNETIHQMESQLEAKETYITDLQIQLTTKEENMSEMKSELEFMLLNMSSLEHQLHMKELEMDRKIKNMSALENESSQNLLKLKSQLEEKILEISRLESKLKMREDNLEELKQALNFDSAIGSNNHMVKTIDGRYYSNML